GWSVSLSSDGNTVIVGGYGDNGNKGAGWAFTRSGGVWTQQGSKLVGTGAIGAAQQGYSVALSSDGNTAIVGGYTDNGGAGAAWVYVVTPPPPISCPFPNESGLGDFNGDSRKDLVFRLSNHGLMYVYFMNGLQIQSAAPIGTIGPEW